MAIDGSPATAPAYQRVSNPSASARWAWSTILSTDAPPPLRPIRMAGKLPPTDPKKSYSRGRAATGGPGGRDAVLNLDAVGTVSEPVERAWQSKDALLYALAVGAGMPDPQAELAFTTENSRDVDQQVLPTFGVLLGMGGGGAMRKVGPFD